MKDMWKVPFRQVYCDTFGNWLRTTFWCHVVIKVFPHVVDFGGDALVDEYLREPKMLFEQYVWMLREISAKRANR